MLLLICCRVARFTFCFFLFFVLPSLFVFAGRSCFLSTLFGALIKRLNHVVEMVVVNAIAGLFFLLCSR